MPASELLSGTAVCVAVAAYWREWQPTPLGAVPQSSGAGTLLEHYVFSPAEAAFSVADVMGSMATWRVAIPLVAAGYLLALMVGASLMQSHAPVRVPKLRASWNLALSAFSAMALSRLLPTLLLAIGSDGLLPTLCARPEHGLGNGASGLWLWLFVVSKLAELLDTAFLVLGCAQGCATGPLPPSACVVAAALHARASAVAERRAFPSAGVSRSSCSTSGTTRRYWSGPGTSSSRAPARRSSSAP